MGIIVMSGCPRSPGSGKSITDLSENPRLNIGFAISSFRGEVLHSRFYRGPEDYAGRRVLVVGSYASGSDLSRHLGGLNVGKYSSSGSRLSNGVRTPDPDGESSSSFTKVYVSSSGLPSAHNAMPKPGDPPQPWQEFITHVPLIDHIDDSGAVCFEGHPPIEVDTIIFATGYNFAYPFCKSSDAPWRDRNVLNGDIEPLEREGGAEEEVGGIKGLGMKGLDELLLFLDGDRSIAFPVLREFPASDTSSSLI